MAHQSMFLTASAACRRASRSAAVGCWEDKGLRDTSWPFELSIKDLHQRSSPHKRNAGDGPTCPVDTPRSPHRHLCSSCCTHPSPPSTLISHGRKDPQTVPSGNTAKTAPLHFWLLKSHHHKNRSWGPCSMLVHSLSRQGPVYALRKPLVKGYAFDTCKVLVQPSGCDAVF
jgi:hypothetical protein